MRQRKHRAPKELGKPALANQTIPDPQVRQDKLVTIGLLSRGQVAQRLGTCRHTVQRLTRRGLLPAVVINQRLIRYAPEHVQALIECATTQRKRASVKGSLKVEGA